MTIAPERPDLEELDFPTPVTPEEEVVESPTAAQIADAFNEALTQVWATATMPPATIDPPTYEYDAPQGQLVEGDLIYQAADRYQADIYLDHQGRGWYCSCSPSRGDYLTTYGRQERRDFMLSLLTEEQPLQVTYLDNLTNPALPISPII